MLLVVVGSVGFVVVDAVLGVVGLVCFSLVYFFVFLQVIFLLILFFI